MRRPVWVRLAVRHVGLTFRTRLTHPDFSHRTLRIASSGPPPLSTTSQPWFTLRPRQPPLRPSLRRPAPHLVPDLAHAPPPAGVVVGRTPHKPLSALRPGGCRRPGWNMTGIRSGRAGHSFGRRKWRPLGSPSLDRSRTARPPQWPQPPCSLTTRRHCTRSHVTPALLSRHALLIQNEAVLHNARPSGSPSSGTPRSPHKQASLSCHFNRPSQLHRRLQRQPVRHLRVQRHPLPSVPRPASQRANTQRLT